MKLYELILHDMELSEDFSIGIFSTSDKAEQTAKYYLQNIQGFKDYPCDYQIVSKQIIGTTDSNLLQVYMIEGWNVNDDFNETDIVESDCYTDKLSAEQKLLEMQKIYSRSEWVLNRLTINERKWTEGFVRV